MCKLHVSHRQSGGSLPDIVSYLWGISLIFAVLQYHRARARVNIFSLDVTLCSEPFFLLLPWENKGSPLSSPVAMHLEEPAHCSGVLESASAREDGVGESLKRKDTWRQQYLS